MFRRLIVSLVVFLLVFLVNISFAQSAVVVFYTGSPVKFVSENNLPVDMKLVLTTHGDILAVNPEGFRTLIRVISDSGAVLTSQNTVSVSIAPDANYLDLTQLDGIVYWFSLTGETEAWVFDEPVLVSIFAETPMFATVVYQEEGQYIKETYGLMFKSSILKPNVVEISYSDQFREYASVNEVADQKYFICNNADHIYDLDLCEEVNKPTSGIY